ncbi:MBOAT, membrane-bound O-acyltransferase family-domain-containing protein [Chytriomyces cf. hyalinus JEL632]|nr:MBOAT, membrane-bound O-acyltransferase family-domain-containing protein [Chytriomyces cf. hyalinus JEL632]
MNEPHDQETDPVFSKSLDASNLNASSIENNLKKAGRKRIQLRHHFHHKNSRKVGKFIPRPSMLDFGTIDREQNPMRGFIVLFWVSMGWYTVSTAWQTFVRTGSPFDMSLAIQMSERGIELAISDLLMIISCFMVVPLVKLVQHKILPMTAAPLMSWIWLGLWFSTAVLWALYNNWGWTQSGAFTIHCIAMLMKQASYLMSNMNLIWKTKELPQLQAEIDLLRAEQEGDSKQRQEQLELLLAEQIQFKTDLKGKVTGLEFPRNLTFLNFVDYMVIPTLVYEIEYPRTKAFRPIYFLEKVLGTFGIFLLLVNIVGHSIIPILEKSAEMHFITCIMRLLVPFMICFILLFQIIFDCVCNAFAELTYFADRQFYEDWWNSTSFEEYARKWNKPVHEFLLRHIYLESIRSYNLSPQSATLLTFFLSSVFHELVMALTGKRLRPWLFLLQMFQIPLIYAARIAWVRERKTLGNVAFWCEMLIGPPLLGAMPGSIICIFEGSCFVLL